MLAGDLQAAAADVEHMAGVQAVAERLPRREVAVSAFGVLRRHQHGDATGRFDVGEMRREFFAVVLQGQTPGGKAGADADACQRKAALLRQFAQCRDRCRKRRSETVAGRQRAEVIDFGARR